MTGPVHTLTPAHERFAIGEPVWLVVRVENHGPDPVAGEVLNAIGVRTSDLHVAVTGPDGQPCPDPDRFSPAVVPMGNMIDRAEVAPGGTGELRIDLSKYAWLDAPGTYTVRLLSPFGAAWGAPVAADDPRWVETRVTLVDPVDPAALVNSLPRTFDDQPTEPMDRNDWDALGHARYVPILEALAAASRPGDRFDPFAHADLRAIEGLAACPCTEATAALLRLYDRFQDPGLRGRVADELLYRIQPAGSPAAWFARRAWDPSFVPQILDRARSALSSSTRAPGWGRAYSFGANVIRKLGDPADGALLAGAIDRTLAGDPQYADVTNSRYGVVQQLDWAMSQFPAPPTVAVSDDARLVLALQGWDRRTGGPQPAGWDDLVLRGLASADPTIVVDTLSRMGPASSPAAIRAVVHLIGSDDRMIALWLRQGMLAPGADARDALLAELAVAPTSRAAALLTALRPNLAPDELLDLALPRIAADPTDPELVGLLSAGLTGCRGGSYGPPPASEVPGLVERWKQLLATDRAALHQGPLPIVPGTTDPALVPSTWRCTLATGQVWPPR